MNWALITAALAIAETPTLKVWHAYRGDEQAALESVIKAYDDAEDTIEIEILAVPYDSFVSKLEAAAPRGNGPDLFIAAHERIGAWSASGLIRPFSGQTDDLHPATVEALSYEGQLFGMPMAYKCLALIINTDILSEPPASTDELLAMTLHFSTRESRPLRIKPLNPITTPLGFMVLVENSLTAQAMRSSMIQPMSPHLPLYRSCRTKRSFLKSPPVR